MSENDSGNSNDGRKPDVDALIAELSAKKALVDSTLQDTKTAAASADAAVAEVAAKKSAVDVAANAAIAAADAVTKSMDELVREISTKKSDFQTAAESASASLQQQVENATGGVLFRSFREWKIKISKSTGKCLPYAS